MKRPKTLKIFGKVYTIKWFKAKNMTDRVAGRIINDFQKIWVDRTNHPQRRRETLIHEVLHAMDFLGALGIDEPNNQRLAGLLLGFMFDNPKLMKWIMKRSGR